MRLALACLVIFSHAWGDGHEPVIFGTTWGRWAVRGFFLLSGYLITKSWLADPNVIRYARRRFARIVPGFIVAFVLSVLAGAFILGVTPLLIFARDLLGLAEPHTVNGIELNRPMWTIKWEILCYAMAPLLLWRRSVFLGVWLILAALTFHFIGNPESKPGWLFAMILSFLTGAALAPLALRFPSLPRLPDMSYGTYLYGWPVMLLLKKVGATDPWTICLLTIPLSCASGYLSFRFVERPGIRWIRNGRQGSASTKSQPLLLNPAPPVQWP